MLYNIIVERMNSVITDLTTLEVGTVIYSCFKDTYPNGVTTWQMLENGTMKDLYSHEPVTYNISCFTSECGLIFFKTKQDAHNYICTLSNNNDTDLSFLYAGTTSFEILNYKEG